VSRSGPLRALRAVVSRGRRRLLQRQRDPGADQEPVNIYSPIPEVPPPEWPGWDRPHPHPGIELDLDAQLRFIEEELLPSMREFSRPPAPPGYDRDNGFYFRGDAEILYAMIRRFRPRLLLELGSGFSTLVSASACAANAAEGDPVRMTSVDPEPRIPLLDSIAPLVRFERLGAEALPPERFLELGRDDILFIDTTHTVKRGSEVNRLVLEVLPRLAPGVLVHFHDIFLPYEYPREWFARGTYLNEQYLVQAMLAENPRWELLLAVHAIARAEPERFAAAIGVELLRQQPAALWIRRTDAAG
jgi:hypothetical protein